MSRTVKLSEVARFCIDRRLLFVVASKTVMLDTVGLLMRSAESQLSALSASVRMLSMIVI